MHPSNFSRAAVLAMLSASVLALSACGRKDETPVPAPAPAPAPAVAAPQPAASSAFVIGGSTPGSTSPTSSIPDAGSMTSTTLPTAGSPTR